VPKIGHEGAIFLKQLFLPYISSLANKVLIRTCTQFQITIMRANSSELALQHACRTLICNIQTLKNLVTVHILLDKCSIKEKW
jgi:hypothetical protein